MYANQIQANAIRQASGIGTIAADGMASEPAAEIEREMNRLSHTASILEGSVARLRERLETLCYANAPTEARLTNEVEPNTNFGGRLRSIDNSMSDSLSVLKSLLDRLAIN